MSRLITYLRKSNTIFRNLIALLPNLYVRAAYVRTEYGNRLIMNVDLTQNIPTCSRLEHSVNGYLGFILDSRRVQHERVVHGDPLSDDSLTDSLQRVLTVAIR